MSKGGDNFEEIVLRARAVELILNGQAERALEELSKFYGIRAPRLKVGLPRRLGRAFGCYDSSRRLICLRSSEEFRNPFVILHEFYHHLRSERGEFAGNEKNADKYAKESILMYMSLKAFNS